MLFFQTIHSDLALRNLLVDAAETIHVADFGLASQQKDATKNTAKPIAWTGTFLRRLDNLLCVAPEAFEGAPTFETDVFSFGVVLWYTISFARDSRVEIAGKCSRDKARTSYG